jgi:serine/threonine protein phosphatase PrpC
VGLVSRVTKDHIANDEELYRNVRGEEDADEYDIDRNTGRLRFISQAFLDRKSTPSVDRAKLKNYDPRQSLISDSNGIVSLITEEVRSIGIVKSKDEKGREIYHAVDVIHDPNPPEDPENDAHSLIIVDPKFLSSDKQGKAFKLMRKALAILATKRGWTLEPSDT